MSNTQRHHIVHQFDDELSELHDLLVEMGSLVDAQMKRVLRALGERDNKIAEQICKEDAAVDDMEAKIDTRCALIIAKRQPAARDMRAIMATIRSIFDLERVGDEITKIARSVPTMSEESTMPKGASQVERLGSDVASMLARSLDAMEQGDVTKAVDIASQDKEIDKLCNNVILTLSRSMQNPEQISSCINLLWIVRSLERIGDHACNLTEHVVYMVRGRDIRHVYNLEDIQKLSK